MVRFHQHPGVAGAIAALGQESSLWLVGLVDQGASAPEDASWAIAACDRRGRVLAWDGWYSGIGRTQPPVTFTQLAADEGWDELNPRERWQQVLSRLNTPWVRYELSFHLSSHPTFGSVVESLLAAWLDERSESEGARATRSAEIVGIWPVEVTDGILASLRGGRARENAPELADAVLDALL